MDFESLSPIVDEWKQIELLFQQNTLELVHQRYYCRDSSIDVKEQGITAEKFLFSGVFRIIADIQIAHSKYRKCTSEHIYRRVKRSAKIE